MEQKLEQAQKESSLSVCTRSRVELGFQCVVEHVAKLLAVLEVESTAAPRFAQLSKGQTFGIAALRPDELGKVTSNVVADRNRAREGLTVEFDKVPHTGIVVSLLGIFGGEVAELAIHVRVEVADQEMRPELVQNVEIIRTCAGGSVIALREGLDSKGGIGLVRGIWRESVDVDRILLVLDPEEG